MIIFALLLCFFSARSIVHGEDKRGVIILKYLFILLCLLYLSFNNIKWVEVNFHFQLQLINSNLIQTTAVNWYIEKTKFGKATREKVAFKRRMSFVCHFNPIRFTIGGLGWTVRKLLRARGEVKIKTEVLRECFNYMELFSKIGVTNAHRIHNQREKYKKKEVKRTPNNNRKHNEFPCSWGWWITNPETATGSWWWNYKTFLFQFRFCHLRLIHTILNQMSCRCCCCCCCFCCNGKCFLISLHCFRSM